MVDCDPRRDIATNHARAAMELAHRFQWEGKWHQGAGHDGTGYVFLRNGPEDVDAFVTPRKADAGAYLIETMGPDNEQKAVKSTRT
jgi:hypothetical protein